MVRALILMAHADDEVLGAGGIIQKLVKLNWDVSVVLMTNGVLDVSDAAWGSWRLHILDVRMGHDRKPNYEAVPR